MTSAVESIADLMHVANIMIYQDTKSGDSYNVRFSIADLFD